MTLDELPGAIPFADLPPEVQLVALYVGYRNGRLDAGVPESGILTFADWQDSND